MTKLNLGAGPSALPGYYSVDIEKADVVVDLRFPPWPWTDNSIEEILASHVIEHFDKRDGYAFLAECHRILEPGGKLYIAVPDLDKFIEAKVFNRPDILGGYRWTDLNNLGGGDESEVRPGWRHRQIYSYESLAFMMLKTGFDPYRREIDYKLDNASYECFSLYMLGVKG